MNKLLRHAVCGLLALGALSCARHTIIPDSELALIFRDAFLANAYISNENIRTDSLRIYEPIFARYGYTTEDVYYTIGNFSKRKSARLGDVVERAIDLLEAEGKVYNREVAILDTIDNVAQRTFTHTVYADSLIRVSSLRDTARLSFTFDVVPGEYTVSLKYLIDSLDRNTRGLKGSAWLERSRWLAFEPLHGDAAPWPRRALHAHLHARHDPPPPACGPTRLRSDSRPPLRDGLRSEGNLHHAGRRCGGQPLPPSVEHPYLCR